MPHIVLIGPIGVGKSTVAPVVGRLLDRPTIELDELRSEVYSALGYDNAEADRQFELHGIPGLIRYWKPFEIELVERAVAREPDAVLDFGAGHSHFEDEDQFRRAAAALERHHVVLLLPSLDENESQRILAERQPAEHRAAADELNATFVPSPSNAALADRVLITGQRSAEDLAADVVRGWREQP